MKRFLAHISAAKPRPSYKSFEHRFVISCYFINESASFSEFFRSILGPRESPTNCAVSDLLPRRFHRVLYSGSKKTGISFSICIRTDVLDCGVNDVDNRTEHTVLLSLTRILSYLCIYLLVKGNTKIRIHICIHKYTHKQLASMTTKSNHNCRCPIIFNTQKDSQALPLADTVELNFSNIGNAFRIICLNRLLSINTK